MQWFINLSTRTKLFLSFGLMLVFLAIVTVTAYLTLMRLQESQEKLSGENFTFALDILEVRMIQAELRAEVISILNTKDKAKQEKSLQQVLERVKDIEALMETLLKLGEQRPGSGTPGGLSEDPSRIQRNPAGSIPSDQGRENPGG